MGGSNLATPSFSCDGSEEQSCLKVRSLVMDVLESVMVAGDVSNACQPPTSELTDVSGRRQSRRGRDT